MIKHKHHIIPKHAGGTDDPNNIVELTIEEHSLAHKALYEQYGRWQDRVAWLSLSGIMKDEERIYEIAKNSNLGNPTGYRHSAQQKEHLSKIRMGDKNPMFGRPAPNRGVSRPGVGGRKRGSKWSEKERQKQEMVRSQPGYYDFTKNPERNKRISEAKKGKPGNALGKSWFNNGEHETYAVECPRGYVKGRTKKELIKKRGMYWFNDGTINKQFNEGSQPKGFRRGRITKK